MEKLWKLKTNNKGFINEIFVFVGILMLIGLYSITFHPSVLTLVSGSSNYGPNSEMYLLFGGAGFFILVVSFYTLFYPKPQAGF